MFSVKALVAARHIPSSLRVAGAMEHLSEVMKLFLKQFRENAKTLVEKVACWQLENVVSILGGVYEDSLVRSCESLQTHFINRHTARMGLVEKPTPVDVHPVLEPTQAFFDGVIQMMDEVDPPTVPKFYAGIRRSAQ